MKIRILSLFIALLLPLQSFGWGVPDYITDPLTDIFANPITVQLYERTCETDTGINKFSKVTDNVWQPICTSVKHSEACKDTPKKDQLDCTTFNDNKVNTFSLDFIAGCATGIWKSVKDFFVFIKNALKWVYQTATQQEKRTKLREQTLKVNDMAMNYLAVEFDKAKEDGASDLEASIKVAKKLMSKVFNAIGKIVQKEFYHFGCLNPQARSEKMCKLVGDIFFPPAFAMALLFKGPKLLRKSKKFANLYKKMKVKRAPMSSKPLKLKSGSKTQKWISEQPVKEQKKLEEIAKSVKNDMPHLKEEEALEQIKNLTKRCK